MCSDRLHRRVSAVAWAAVACAFMATTAQAGRWTNHLDASVINEIVPRGNVLYMATFGGLVLYHTDTGEFEQFTNDAGLLSNTLSSLVFDADDNLYIGSAEFGVAKVRVGNGQITVLRSLSEQIDGLASNTVNSLAVWGEDIVYGSTPGAGLIRKDFASARYFQRDGLPGADVLDVLPMGDEVWMATDGGVATLDRLGLIQTVAGGPAEANVLGTDGTRIWVGTDSGVRRFDPGDDSWTDVGPAGQKMYSLGWDGATMWGASTRNLLRYSGSGQAWTFIIADSLLLPYQFNGGAGSVQMRGLGVVSATDVYMGCSHPTDVRGANLLHFDGTHLTNLKSNTPTANNIVRLTVDVDGSLWASTFSFYVGKLMPSGNWVNYNSSISGIQIPSNKFTNIAFLADSGGHKWFSTLTDPRKPSSDWMPLDELDDRLDSVYSNDTWTRHTLGSGGGDGLGSLRPQRAAEDPAGNRWFLSDYDVDAVALGWRGINILSRDKSQWFQMTMVKDPRMIADNVVDVAFGSTYAYVAFLEDGVYLWNHGGYDWPALTDFPPDRWEVRVAADSLPSEAFISRLQLRSDGRLWVATSGGLFYYQNGKISDVPVYTGIGPGIVSPGVRDILLDHDQNLWVATDAGLNRIARNDNDDIQTFMTPASFARLAGLRYPLEVIAPLAGTDCQSLAIHPTRDILYIGTFGGLSAYDFTAAPSTPTDLTRVYVYPNPVYASKGHDSLKIANLTGPVTVEIYNLEGELVDSRPAAADGDVVWDLTDRGGIYVGSGNYIVRIVGPTGSTQRTVAVLR